MISYPIIDEYDNESISIINITINYDYREIIKIPYILESCCNKLEGKIASNLSRI